MGFIVNALGSVFRTLLDPILKMFWSLTYGILIRGPLQFLQSIDRAFQYFSGSAVDKLIFGTSLVDGKPQLNFFASKSPLLFPFLVMLGIAAFLAVILFMLSFVKSVYKTDKNTGLKTMRFLTGGIKIFAVPLVFLVLLSVTGTFISLIAGNNVSVSIKDTSTYQTEIQSKVDTVKYNSKVLGTLLDKNTKWIPGLTYSKPYFIGKIETMDEIYQALEKDTKFGDLHQDKSKAYPFNKNIANLANISQESYKDMREALFDYQNNTPELNLKLSGAFNDISQTLAQLKKGQKNEKLSEKVKKATGIIYQTLTPIQNWEDSMKELLSYVDKNTGINSSVDKQLLFNLKTRYEQIKNSSFNVSSINSLEQYTTTIKQIMNGSPSAPNIGTHSLATKLSVFTNSTIVTIFYQIATGNNDTYWDRGGIVSMRNGGSSILIGFFIIIGAIVILFMSSLFVVGRIINLSMLFIISPVVVLMSFQDDNARMKMWMKMVLGQLLSIFGIVIGLRLFGSLTTRFSSSLNISDGSGSGFIYKHVLLAIWAIGGMLAAYSSSSIISKLCGAGSGIMGGIQGLQMIKTIFAASAGSALVAGRMAKHATIGKASAGRNVSGLPGSPGASGGIMNRMKSVQLNRARKIQSFGKGAMTALAIGTGNKLGTMGGKTRALNRKTGRNKAKLDRHITRREKTPKNELHSRAREAHIRSREKLQNHKRDNLRKSNKDSNKTKR